MCSADKIKFMSIAKLLYLITAESYTNASFLVIMIPFLVCRRVRSKQISHQSLLYINGPFYICYLFYILQFGTNSTMSAKYFILYDRNQRQSVENILKRFSKLQVEFFLAFIIKAVLFVDFRTFVVATEHKKVFGIFDLIAQQKTYCLNGLFAPVDVVAEEKIILMGREAVESEQPFEVVKLTVDITTYLNRRLEFQQ